MTYPSGKAAVVGVYTTKMGKDLGKNSLSLQLEAIKGALADAGLTASEVDGLVPLELTPRPGEYSAHMFWAEQLGERPITFMDIGQGAAGVAKAAVAIAAGMANVVVVFWGTGGFRIGPRGVDVPDEAPRVPPWQYTVHGAFMTPWYAMWAQRYMHEFKVTSEDLAEVAVIARDYAVMNPNSVMGSRGPITVDDVVNSRMISDPFHLLDCSLENEGGYAIVVASQRVARFCRSKPIWILGGAESTYTDMYTTINKPWFPEEGKSVRKVADLAFQMAGVSRDEMDVAELYDCFTVTTLRDLEEMGFCKIGEGAEYVKEGHTRLTGSMPTNTDGGLLSNSHCVNPSGLQTIELVRQLRGECGERQVPNAKIGVALAQGMAVHGMASTVILAN